MDRSRQKKQEGVTNMKVILAACVGSLMLIGAAHAQRYGSPNYYYVPDVDGGYQGFHQGSGIPDQTIVRTPNGGYDVFNHQMAPTPPSSAPGYLGYPSGD